MCVRVIKFREHVCANSKQDKTKPDEEVGDVFAALFESKGQGTTSFGVDLIDTLLALFPLGPPYKEGTDLAGMSRG